MRELLMPVFPQTASPAEVAHINRQAGEPLPITEVCALLRRGVAQGSVRAVERQTSGASWPEFGAATAPITICEELQR